MNKKDLFTGFPEHASSSETYAPCERFYLRLKIENPTAMPVFGFIVEDKERDIDLASKEFLSNIRRNFFSRLHHATHVVADVDGEYIDAFPQICKIRQFVTRQEIITYLLERHYNESTS